MRTIYTIRRKLYNDVLGLGGIANAAGGVINNTVNTAGQIAKQGVNTVRDVTGGLARKLVDMV